MDELRLSQRHQSLVRQPALLFVIVVSHVTANVICRTNPGNDSCWLGAMALTICDVGLLSWWAALGCKNVLLGLSVWVAGMTFLFTLYVHRYCNQQVNQYITQPNGWLWIMCDPAMFPVLLAPITLLCVALVGGVLQHCGVALSIARTENHGFARVSKRGRYQFSVRDMLVFVTTVAASLGTVATIQPNPRWLLDGIQILSECAVESSRKVAFLRHHVGICNSVHFAHCLRLTPLGEKTCCVGRRGGPAGLDCRFRKSCEDTRFASLDVHDWQSLDCRGSRLDFDGVSSSHTLCVPSPCPGPATFYK